MNSARMRLWMCVLVWSVACGNVSTLSMLDAANTIDTRSSACDLTRPFGTPMPVMGVNSAANENEASLSADELTIYFASNRSPGGPNNIELYSATRPTTTGSFGTASLLTALNSASNDESVSLTGDGLTIFFASNRSGNWDLYLATRTSPAADFGMPATVAGVNEASAIDAAPYINDDGSVLYFQSDRGGTRDIYRAIRVTETTAFGPPVLVAELSSPTALDELPVVTNDGLTVYFASDRPGGNGGGFDIWAAHRTTTQDGFGVPMPEAALNSVSDDVPFWISADRCRFLLGSNRPGGAGGFDIYMASRPL